MKDFDDYTNEEIFNLCANKSIEEIKAMEDEDLQRQAIRYYFSRLLMDYTDEKPLEGIEICVEQEEACGLSTLLMPWVTKMSQTECEGYLNVYIEGQGWVDIDYFKVSEQLQLLEDLIEQI